MKDIGMDRKTAEKLMAALWKKFQRHARIKAAIEKAHTSYHHRWDWKMAEDKSLVALRALRPIKESGVVPWLDADYIGSVDTSHEYWAIRVMAVMYNEDYTERSVVKAISMRTPQQSFGMTKEQAEHLRDQLTYELDRWDEE